MISLAVLTGWDTRYEVATNIILAVASSALLWLLLRRTFAHRTVLAVAAFVVSVIVFSPSQYENWLWGWQIQWFLNLLALIAAVWALSGWRQSPWPRLVVAAAAATVATYSLASGFLVWLICLPLIWLTRTSSDLCRYGWQLA